MIGHIFATAQKIRWVFDPNRWVIRLLGLSKFSESQKNKGLILIQIDGLSHTHFQHAIKRGYLPFIKELKLNEGYKDWHHYSGLPSCTPSIQGELFYGIKQSVPAFRFLDHQTKKVFTFYDSETASTVEARLQKEGKGLLEGGSSYCNIFRGGAEENAHFCVASIGWKAFLKAVRPSALGTLIFFNILSLFRVLYFLIIETFLAFVDSVRGGLNGFGFVEEFKFILSRLIVTVGLKEIAVLGTKLDIARGLPVIHVNFFGYDDQAHRRGPGSSFAYWSLPGIDNAIRRIWKYAQNALLRDYAVWIYSDHGQEEVTPYPVEQGKSIEKAVSDLFHEMLPGELFELEENGIPGNHGCRNDVTKGGRKNSRTAEKTASPYKSVPGHGVLVVAAQGPVGYIYPHREFTSEEKKRIAEALVRQIHVPLVLTCAEGIVYAFTKEGEFRLPGDIQSILGDRHPYPGEVSEELVQLCRNPDAGAFVISGYRRGRRSISFPQEYGSHAGPGPHETDGFAFFPKDIRVKSNEKNYLRPLSLRETAFSFLRGDEGVFYETNTSRLAKHHLRVMTYNVHSCRGMDGRLSPERIARVIARHDPDIIALQELDSGRSRTEGMDQAHVIAKLLDMNHHFHPVLTIEEEMYGNAVLSRYPIKVIRAGSLPRFQQHAFFEHRGALWVEIDYQGVPIQLINTHLSFWGKEQNIQSEALCGNEWLGNKACKGNIILCGDLNALPQSPVCRCIGGRLQDVQLIADQHQPLNTWLGHFPLSRIDHIFVSRSIKTLKVEVPASRLEKVASDHLPLIAELHISPKSCAFNSREAGCPDSPPPLDMLDRALF